MEVPFKAGTPTRAFAGAVKLVVVLGPGSGYAGSGPRLHATPAHAGPGTLSAATCLALTVCLGWYVELWVPHLTGVDHLDQVGLLGAELGARELPGEQRGKGGESVE